MERSFAIGATVACLVLSFCIAAAITAQASHTWWKIESLTADKQYSFGLYRVCVYETNNTEACYRFDPKEIRKFLKEQLPNIDSSVFAVKAENQVSQNIWIISFFAILCTGMAFLLSVPTAFLSWHCDIGRSVPMIQCILTALGTILGITSIAYAFDQRKSVWYDGVKALKQEGFATGKVEFVGQGYLFQCLYSVIEVIAFVVNVFLLKTSFRRDNSQK